MANLKSSEYFPKNYEDSRKQFLTRVEKVPGAKKLGRWEIPGRRDKDLFVDHVWLGPLERPEKLIVMTSGIHGAETYAGAAIQNMFFDEILPKINRQRTGILIVHSMNPYGFKHHTRCTESGINLNRNFSVSGELFKVRNEPSAQFCERFLERAPVRSVRSQMLEKMSEKNGQIYFAEMSLDDIIKSFAPGQFERPKDLEYGGKEAEPQTRLLIQKLQEHMPSYRDVMAFDLHTGLGEVNRLHLLTDGGKTLNPDLFQKLFKVDEDEEFYTFTPSEEEGFYPVHGALNGAFGELAQDRQRVCSITMEFGTLGHSLQAQVEGLNDFVVNHQGVLYGYANPEIEQKALASNFARSRPMEPKWEQAVIESSRGLFNRVFGRADILINTDAK
jgi:predicted deacylase